MLRHGVRPLLWVLAILAVLLPATAARAEPSVDLLEGQIEAQSAQLERIVEQFNKVTEDLKTSQAAAGQVAAALSRSTDALASSTQRIGELAASAYKGASLAELTSVFDSGDPSTVVDRMVVLDRLTRFETGQLTSYTETRSRVDEEKAKLDELIAAQTAQRDSLEERRRKIISDLAALNDLLAKANGQLSAAPRAATHAASSATPPAVSGKAGAAVAFAYAQLGKPYEWAADGPGSYDCSGLTMAAWRVAGVSLPHNAAMQWDEIPHIARTAIRPGDLVFYSGLDHVAMYVGDNQIIHAPTFNDHVRLASIDLMTPYGYGRPG